ncbi:MAG: lipopolysaccharide kinase InaA family protein [Verrucomicrobiae bacterium]|nr:lipopolysaccharide kinase InaA family protein [Verrucomicrobiae bacterium]NNJ43714.1 hypothetical protein [Akkermansiaceae bacterium]
MPNKSFTDPEWTTALEQAGYSDFDTWWDAEGEQVEVGNFRGKDDNTSWSHVCRIHLDNGKTIYLKRQQNHYPTNLILKLRKVPTFELEWRNYQRLQEAGIPTMKIVYFASRKKNGNHQCIVVSESLVDMSDIDQLARWYAQHGWPPRAQRLAILDSILKVIKKMHQAGMIHNALYGRHLYLNIPFVDGAPVEVPEKIHTTLIDLERTKYPGPRSRKMIDHDLRTMFKYIPEWPARDCLWFLKKYLGIDKLTPEAKAIILDLVPRRKKKRPFVKPDSPA